MKNPIKTSAVVATLALALGGCDLLDVDNPNNLVEESIRREAAANAVVNGSQALVASAVSQIWQPYLVASDEFYWIGSRDAWLQLDQGFISNPANEFTDAAFPSIAQARWMADEAVEILTEHVAETPTAALQTELARAHLFAGIIHMIIGEVQEDFAESDKMEAGPPKGPSNMYTLLEEAITHLNAAVDGLSGEQRTQALAVRARARHSLEIWHKIKPSPNTADPLVSSQSAVDDALAVIGAAGGVGADWNYNFHYSAGTVDNDMADWINDRKENQVDLSLVTVTAANDIDQIALMDPIDDVPDPALEMRISTFKDGPFNSKGSVYPPMTLASTRLMHLIAAEHALANGDDAGFTTHINHVRAMDELTPYSGQVPAMDMLQHERRVNLFVMGLRLSDMYRFGVQDVNWEPAGDAIKAPGTRLPITNVEITANCHMNGLGC
ncbi:MAG TPA: hypothetical protein VK849_01335 [Longimicrobiales bacterium]|nr:hypothetical protein [Longimicrobiales bacterium]